MQGAGASLGVVPLKLLALDADSTTIEGEPAGPRTVILEFDSEAELKAYLNSREHEEHVTQRFRPLIASRAIVSYEVAHGAVTDLFRP